LVLISHFHLDHCAALPYLTERFKYTGPIYASDPTKAILPYMLKDFINVTKEDQVNLTHLECDLAVNKVKPIFLKETIEIQGAKITPYYAGHVLGAVMFLIEKDGLSVLYTGDYNTSPDRHLRACEVDRINPDLVISEATYGTVNREWRKERELKFV
jgi:Cft2 family RNA processing exonuclease